jgi:hypothetical protein
VHSSLGEARIVRFTASKLHTKEHQCSAITQCQASHCTTQRILTYSTRAWDRKATAALFCTICNHFNLGCHPNAPVKFTTGFSINLRVRTWTQRSANAPKSIHRKPHRLRSAQLISVQAHDAGYSHPVLVPQK